MNARTKSKTIVSLSALLTCLICSFTYLTERQHR